MHDDLLFHKYDFGAAIRNAPAAIREAVDGLSDADLLSEDVDSLVERLVTRHAVSVPKLDPDAITVEEGEVEIDVSGDPRRVAFGSGPYYVRATEYRFFIPFAGDRDVFFCQPSTFDYNPPRAEVRERDLVIRIIRRDEAADAVAIRKQFDEVVGRIKTYLTRLQNDASRLPDELRKAAKLCIEQRRAKRQKDAAVVDALGFPKRTQQA